MVEALRIRHILVALDPSAAGRAALQMAARLAAESAAELRGVFVEDDELCRLAGLPIAAEVRPGMATAQALSLERLAREWAAQARGLERDLAGQAAQWNVSWSFRVVRSTAGAELGNLGQQADLVLCAGGAGARYRPRGLGRPARELARQAGRTLLLAGRTGLHGPVCALCEPGGDRDRVLDRAAGFQRLLGGPLVVLDASASDAVLPARALRRRLHTGAVAGVASAARDCGLLVLDGGASAADEDWLRQLTDEFAGSVLLVR